MTSIPVDQKAGVIATFKPAAADVGKEADYYMVINAGNTWLMRTATGFSAWNSERATLKPFATKTMLASETISVADLETLAGVDYTGQKLSVYVGYMTSTSPLTYSSAIEFTMASAPSSSCPNDGFVGIAPKDPGGKRQSAQPATERASIDTGRTRCKQLV